MRSRRRTSSPVDIPRADDAVGPEDDVEESDVRRRWLDRASTVAKPLIVLLILCVAWQIVVDQGVVQRFLLASPTEIISYIIDNPGELLRNAWATVREVVLGFGAALVLSLVLGVLMFEFRVLEDSLLPIFVLNTVIPTIAIAPLLVLFLGFGLTPKVVTAMLVCVFPMVVNTVAGLKSLDADTESLGLSLRANRWKMLTFFRLPNALPFIFTGARTGIALAVIGAVIGEFVSAQQGLGWLVLQASSILNTPQLYASLAALAFVGIALFSLVRIAEWLAMPWRRRVKS
jgi:NitT/TauT family transport system permease protein